ncbi:polymerase, partial [Neisseria meningitidis]
FTGIRYETAVERVANGGFPHLARHNAWKKAPSPFPSPPLFRDRSCNFAPQNFLIKASQPNK